MSSNRSLSLMMVVLLAASAAFAQAEDPVPLKNWPAPLYWQPSTQERAGNHGIGEGRPRSVHVESMSTTFPSAPLVYVAITPCRLVDTRTGTMPVGYGPPSMTADSTRTIAAPGGGCGLPAAEAYSVTVTVVPPGGAMMRWLTLYPTGTTLPLVATLNDRTGLIINNAAIVPTGTPLGSFNIYVKDATDVVIDVNGYYVEPTALALGAGAVGAPALSFGDATTGLYSNGAGSVSIATGGTERVRVTGGMLSVDGSLDFSSALTLSGANLLRANSTDLFLGIGAKGPLGAGQNSALGAGALGGLTSGNGNTAVGYSAGASIDTTSYNLAVGTLALFSSTGSYNTAVGSYAGNRMTSGTQNTLVGMSAGDSPITGASNVAVGDATAYHMTSGTSNTFVGSSAGYNLQDGNYNIAVGSGAGWNIASGSHNVYIGASPFNDESHTIRIGDGWPTRAFIDGIRGVAVTGGQTVQIDANGQLGSTSSSRRFKQDIRDLGDTADVVMALRPVRFRYKSLGADSPEQYGLIAEEVSEISPELVGRDKEGEIDSVAYDKVSIMLLKLVQEQQRTMQDQQRTVQEQQKAIQRLESRLAELEGADQ